MPVSWLKSVLTPALALQASFASMFAYLASMNMALRWMLYGICFHILTTIACVLFLDNGKGRRHVGKDVIVKGIAFWIVSLLGHQPELQLDVAGQSVSVGAILAGYFLLGEWLGVVQDLAELDMPVPSWVKMLLTRAKDGIDNANVGAKAIGAFTSFTSQKVGDTEVIRKTETVVTQSPPTEAPHA